MRKQGELKPVPVAWKTRAIDFGKGPRPAVCMPWGDVATAYHSTGIPDIEVYMTFPPATVQAMKIGQHLGWLLRAPGVAGLIKRRIRAGAPGPSDAERAAGASLLWGRVEDEAGHAVEARMRTPEGYTPVSYTHLTLPTSDLV